MAMIDLAIVVVLLISVVVGFLRGFIKEAVSVFALVLAAWASLRFAPFGSSLIENVTGFGPLESSQGARMWLGRALIFFAILAIGGLVGWLLSYLIKSSGLTGTDRMLGLGFGLIRGALVLGIIALALNYLGFSQDAWWKKGRLVPYVERVGDAVKVLAPRALEYIKEQSPDDELDEGVPEPAPGTLDPEPVEG